MTTWSCLHIMRGLLLGEKDPAHFLPPPPHTHTIWDRSGPDAAFLLPFLFWYCLNKSQKLRLIIMMHIWCTWMELCDAGGWLLGACMLFISRCYILIVTYLHVCWTLTPSEWSVETYNVSLFIPPQRCEHQHVTCCEMCWASERASEFACCGFRLGWCCRAEPSLKICFNNEVSWRWAVCVPAEESCNYVWRRRDARLSVNL